MHGPCFHSSLNFPEIFFLCCFWNFLIFSHHSEHCLSLSPVRYSVPTYTNSSPFCCCCSVAKSYLILCDPIEFSTPGSSVLHYLPEFAQIHVHWTGVAIQPSHLLQPSSPFAFNLSQNQGLFQWVDSLHQVAKVLELQLQHQSFQWIFKVDFL